jgi:HTH-type transcriptional regulator, sugar sensing transcriptional regulator
MIVNETFLKKLRSAFDLNIYEVKIWTALLSRGMATAGELSHISNVPRSRSYDVLESLEKKGFVIMKLGKPIKYIAVEPKEILKRVRKLVKDKADKQINFLEKVKSETIFNEIELLYKNGINHVDPNALSGSLKGRNNIYNQMDALVSNAKKSVIISTTGEGFERKMDLLKGTLKKLADKKVKIKIATESTPENKELIKEVSAFADIRKLNGNAARFVLVDSNELLFMTANDKDIHESYDIGIWVNTPFFASALENLFNMSWGKLAKI